MNSSPRRRHLRREELSAPGRQARADRGRQREPFSPTGWQKGRPRRGRGGPGRRESAETVSRGPAVPPRRPLQRDVVPRDGKTGGTCPPRSGLGVRAAWCREWSADWESLNLGFERSRRGWPRMLVGGGWEGGSVTVTSASELKVKSRLWIRRLYETVPLKPVCIFIYDQSRRKRFDRGHWPWGAWRRRCGVRWGQQVNPPAPTPAAGVGIARGAQEQPAGWSDMVTAGSWTLGKLHTTPAPRRPPWCWARGPRPRQAAQRALEERGPRAEAGRALTCCSRMSVPRRRPLSPPREPTGLHLDPAAVTPPSVLRK